MQSTVETEGEPKVSARRFVAAFFTAAESMRAELIPIWRDSTKDAPYTAFMTTRVFPATAEGLALQMSPEFPYVDAAGRRRRLDASFYFRTSAPRLQDVLVAIELENKQTSLSDEIKKLSSLQSPLCVLFFYSSEAVRDGRLREIQGHVRGWEESTDSEYLIMWNKPYQKNPHWVPFLVTPSGTEELVVGESL